MKNSLLVAFALALFMSCTKDDAPVDYVIKNDQDIQAYIATHNLIAQKSSTGLYYVIDTQGTGAQPTKTDKVTVAYKGYYLNGKVFDQSNAEGISFYLQQVIKGWTEGITYFKVGGSGKLLVPAHLGYGNKKYRGIPGGSVLIFDVALKAVN